MIDKIKEIVSQIKEADQIFNSTASWEIKYDAIFAMEIHHLIREAGFTFEWYDPDSSYEDDVRCYFSALEKFKDDLGDLVEKDKDSDDVISDYEYNRHY
jgi:maltooligosyltrehalose synthase